MGEEREKDVVSPKVGDGRAQGVKAAGRAPELLPEHEDAGAGSVAKLFGRRTESGSLSLELPV